MTDASDTATAAPSSAPELTAARTDVWPLVGEVALQFTRPDEVYRGALAWLNQPVAHIPPGEAWGFWTLYKSNLKDNHRPPLNGIMPGERKRMKV